MPGSTSVKCKNCGANVDAHHVNIQEMVAICPTCGHMFRLDEIAKQLEKAPQRKVKAPENFDVYDSDEEVHISYRYRKNMSSLDKMGNVVWSIAWVFFTMLLVAAIASGNIIALGVGITLFLFTSYALMVGLLNTRHIVLDQDTLSWYDEPIPVPFKAKFNVHEIDHVSIEPSANANGYYQVLVHRRDGTSGVLLNYLPRINATFIQQTLQAQLQDQFGEWEDQPFNADYESEQSVEQSDYLPEEAQHGVTGSR